MPEYLAPGVYVEETDTGTKPIEAASTSTAGAIGVTERGPVDVPILITSSGEYTRWFGQGLRRAEFSNALGAHCYLPHAIDGFFTNSGKRVYVTRVLDTNAAAKSEGALFDRGDVNSANTTLLRAMGENTGTVISPPLPVVLPSPNLALNDWIRIGDGSDAEYRQITAAPVPDDVTIPLGMPLSRAHTDTAPINVEQFTPAAPIGAFQLSVTAPATRTARGERVLEITGTPAAITALSAVFAVLPLDPPLLKIVGKGLLKVSEYRFALTFTLLAPTRARVTLDSGLRLSYENNSTVNHFGLLAAAHTAQLDPAARMGDAVLFVDTRGGNFATRTDLIVIGRSDKTAREVRTIGELRRITLNVPAASHYPAGAIIEGVTVQDDNHILMNAAVAAATSFVIPNAAHGRELSVQQHLLLGGANPEEVVVQSIAITTLPGLGSATVTLKLPLQFPKAVNVPVIPVRALTAAAHMNASSIAIDNRLGINPGDVLRIGSAPGGEFVTVVQLPLRAPAGADSGNVIFTPALVADHAIAGTQVVRQADVTSTDVQASALVFDAPLGSTTLVVSDGGGGAGTYAANTFIRITTLSDETFYHRVNAISPVPLSPVMLTLDDELHRSHRLGAPVIERRPLLAVQALDAGAWGNRLRISVEDEPSGLASRTTLSQIISPTRIRLASAAGVEAGTVLEFSDISNALIGEPVKVVRLSRANNEISIAGVGLSAAQQVLGLKVRSREFSITVYLLRQPDPATPSRNNTVIDSETFRYLSMDPRHSRYAPKVIGDFGPSAPIRPSDRRSDGESWYVRVHDRAQDLPVAVRQTTLERVRVGPEGLVDVLSDGRLQAAWHPLDSVIGDDALATLTDVHYIGVDDPNPEKRTGLQSLRNIEEISIVASPGRVSPALQNALINHCETLRYRFAVLDGPPPPHDDLNSVQTQRQQFDTKYAALYHPWLLIPEPYPTSAALSADYPIPPSGHMLGVYARTDVERGVHKAPANEVVRGVIGLQRLINKEQHDILNPYPVNINVIRDFRKNSRGIRVYGGRVITSDSDWKYVNVRRLLIFIENSIDRGLQWAVFEPNAEPLWARVRRSIANFLTLVWRNGGLEGAKVEEAFFVKCDRTTMTQTDIDSGRLICVVGVAPVKPAEFVIVRIGLWTAHADN